MLLKLSHKGSSICGNKLAVDCSLPSLFIIGTTTTTNDTKSPHYHHHYNCNHRRVSAHKQQGIESSLKATSSNALFATYNWRLSDGQSSSNNSSVDTSLLHDLTMHNYASSATKTKTSTSDDYNSSRTSSMVPARMESYTKEECAKCRVALFHMNSGLNRHINCLTKRFLSSRSWLAKSIEFSTPSSYNQHQLTRQVTTDSGCASDHMKQRQLHDNNKPNKQLSLSNNYLIDCDDTARDNGRKKEKSDKRNDRSNQPAANNDWRPGENHHQIKPAIISQETLVELKVTGPPKTMQARRVRNNTDEDLSEQLADVHFFTTSNRARNAEHNKHIREEIAKQVMTGKKQSPISLMSQNPIYKQCNKPLMLEYPTTLDNLKLNNTGFTWEVKLPYQQSMLTALSGASLPYLNRYRLDQFHCHWGADNKAGSEHSVDGHLYTAELHFVHYNMEKYHSMSKAQLHPDGLAVVAVFLEASNDHLNHAELDKVSTNLRLIPNKGDSVTLKQSIRLDNLLPSANRSYWTYHGSLTTPPFYESVTWFVLKQPIRCSVAQIDKFRHINGSPCCASNLSSGNSSSSFSNNNNNNNSTYNNNNNNNLGSNNNDKTVDTVDREDSAGSSKHSTNDSSINNNNDTVGHKCAKNIVSNHRATQPLHGRVVCNHDDECSSYPRSIIRQ